MPDDVIRINDFALNISAGKPITYHGKHSGKTLAGIDLDFFVRERAEVERVEELFATGSAQIVDPFANRSYKASLRKLLDSWQDGCPERHYTAEIRETDTPPQFKVLEVDGRQFDVMKYVETEHGVEAIGRHALLRLSKEQFTALQGILSRGTVQLKRLGVDDAPLTARCGSATYWSEHEEGGLTYFKQIVRFYPPDLPATPTGLALSADHNAVAGLVVRLSARFEALVNELTTSGFLSNEQRDRLLGKNWRGLLDEAHVAELMLQTQRLLDAEDEL